MVNVAVVVATGVNNEGRASRSASTSSPPRTGRAGRRSCAPWWPEAYAAWPWSLPTTTKGTGDGVVADLRPPSRWASMLSWSYLVVDRKQGWKPNGDGEP